ncbi:head maturation protease, ClpP-related [Weissella minor]|uniref:ATP-dependent Clp protease proteolytic subunit n=1 Tax=Weissella minor TaxID=1620 RepID=A0A0R2JJR4_9LACO|nr:head maturation protease, ClpP-related [Weissella minor]KRN77491.1 peptidase S14, ClpP [Weissella minor]
MKTLDLIGPVVGNDSSWIYDFLEIDCISPNKVKSTLNDLGDDDLTINLSSGGGEVTAASEIYTALRQIDKEVTINITGMAASAASVIAMGANIVNISPTAQFMIHQASVSETAGNKDKLTHVADMLDKTDQSIAQAYVERTGVSMDEIAKMMADETFLTATEAVEYGFADNIMFANQATAKATNSIETGLLSTDAINKVGTLIAKQSQNKNSQKNKTNNNGSRLAQRSAKATILLED